MFYIQLVRGLLPTMEHEFPVLGRPIWTFNAAAKALTGKNVQSMPLMWKDLRSWVGAPSPNLKCCRSIRYSLSLLWITRSTV